MTIWAVLTHLGAFVLGAVMWNFIARREGRAAIAHPPEGDDTPVVTPASRRTIRRTFTGVGGAILLASLLVIALGVQQQFNQAAQTRRDACVSDWGRDLTETLDRRVQANTAAASATRRRDDAARRVLDVLARLSSTPPEAQNAELLAARVSYALASARLERAQERVVDTQAVNPYPVLDCEK